jgi:pentatricopeptide repeat protein
VAELERWILEGREIEKDDLKQIVKGLRKYNRPKEALEIFEWMGQKFSFSSGERAIHLDLIAKANGITSAEKYFTDLPDIEKNHKTYSVLLNCYVKEKNIEKSEATMEKLKDLGFAKGPLSFNGMMALYINTEQFDKVPSVIWEMKKNGISLNAYSYNFWMRSYAALSDMDKVEDVLNEMQGDGNVDTDWTTYSTLVNFYMHAKDLDKAESTLKEAENKMKKMEAKRKRKDRAAYDHLIRLHGSLGNKDEVYRIWKSFESAFPEMTNRSYMCLLSSLVGIGDIEGAEDFLKKWESVKLFDDIRVSHVLLVAYIKNGWLPKAEVLLERIIENGGKPNADTWEILAEGYIQNGQIHKAMEAMTKSVSVGQNTPWQPKFGNVLAILKHFEKQGDVKSAEEFFKIFRGLKILSTEIYNCLLRTYLHGGKVPPKISELMIEENICPDEETDILLKRTDEF